MTKVNIISGFLGAGKTTLIKKLLDGAFKGEKVVLLENEYGEVGIDGGFMRESGIQISELNSGCICCTLVGDFADAMQELIEKYSPDRILIEPSGVGKLSDIRRVVLDNAEKLGLALKGCATVADVSKCRLYIRNFGEFFNDQIKSAETIILSRTQTASEDRIEKAVAMLRELNERARIITTPWDQLDSEKMLATIEAPDFLLTMEDLFPDGVEDEHEHHHHHYDENGVCSCGHHHDDDDDDDDDDEHDEHEHHHHHDHDDHDEDEHEHEHHHHHDHDHDDDDHDEDEHEHHHHDHDHDDDEHDEDEHEHHHHCGCGHHHHHHHGHDADEVFENIGVETPKKFEETAIREAVEQLEDEKRFGAILRAKGILPLTDGRWVEFDYVPGESEFRESKPDYTGRLCVIGCKINEEALKAAFGI